jgi:hypothetical protein
VSLLPFAVTFLVVAGLLALFLPSKHMLLLGLAAAMGVIAQLLVEWWTPAKTPGEVYQIRYMLTALPVLCAFAAMIGGRGRRGSGAPHRSSPPPSGTLRDRMRRSHGATLGRSPICFHSTSQRWPRSRLSSPPNSPPISPVADRGRCPARSREQRLGLLSVAGRVILM